MKLPASKSLTAVGCLALLAMVPSRALQSTQTQSDDPSLQPGAPHESNIVIGELPPDFVLQSIDGETYDLAAQRGERPILLVFFRGAW